MSSSLQVTVADEYGTLVVSHGDNYVCEMVCSHKTDAEMANLFAAAPDMLAALKMMKGYGDVFAYRAGRENPYEVICAAIAKAEGKENDKPDTQ